MVALMVVPTVALLDNMMAVLKVVPMVAPMVGRSESTMAASMERPTVALMVLQMVVSSVVEMVATKDVMMVGMMGLMKAAKTVDLKERMKAAPMDEKTVDLKEQTMAAYLVDMMAEKMVASTGLLKAVM